MSTVTTTTAITEQGSLHVTPATSRGYSLSERGPQNISMGNGNPHPIPQFNDPYKKREWILEHMAGAFRVFGRKGYDEGIAGHISVRDPVEPDTFWINPLGIHFSMLNASDMIRVDEDGNILDNSNGSINAAGFAIHSALHKMRPDVNAACHTHSTYGKAYSCFAKPLEMLNQSACNFYGSHGVYADFGGVALEKDEGKRVAEAVGNGHAAILMNHGLITVGETVDEAAFQFTLMESTCQAQLLADAAESSGYKKHIISDEEASYCHHMNADAGTLYLAFQNDLRLEMHLDDSFLSFTKSS